MREAGGLSLPAVSRARAFSKDQESFQSIPSMFACGRDDRATVATKLHLKLVQYGTATLPNKCLTFEPFGKVQ